MIEQMNNYANLKDNEIELLNSIEQQIQNNEDFTIRSIAKLNYVSTSTIFKLVKKLGFTGYSEMIFNIKNLSSHDSKDIHVTSMQDIISNYSQDTMQEFINILIQNENHRISLLGLGFSEILCDYISRRLSLFDFFTYNGAHLDMHLNAVSNKPVQLLIVISKSGETDDLIRNIETARGSNITIVSFTANRNSTIAMKSDITFEICSLSSINLSKIDTFSPLTMLAFEYIIQLYCQQKNLRATNKK